MDLLPLLDATPPERADAARNREALLRAAQELVACRGVEAVTMDEVAERAGVGKGTVFRRFTNREGLMGALLDSSESEWQGRVIFGPPPLGPGAPPLDRLHAFGHSRIDLTLHHARLIDAAGHRGARPFAAVSFSAMHVRHLLTLLGVQGDIGYLATTLMAPLEVVILEQQTHIEQMPVARIRDGWDDLVRRVVGLAPPPAP